MTLNKTKIGTVLVAVYATVVGLFCSPLSRNYPLFHWLVRLSPPLTGMTPALSPQPWGYTLERLERTDLRGQAALVTGANSGIGFETARALSRQGAAVTLACRNPQRCFTASDKIRKEEGYSGAPVQPLVMDVSDLASVKRAAKTYLMMNDPKLDMLFLNAGIFFDQHEEGATALPLSKDGIEKVFATNVVGHHLLYRILEPALKKSTMARVVSTSSMIGLYYPTVPATLEELNRGRPSAVMQFALYGRSKVAQVAWAGALTRRLGDGSTIRVNSAHPGSVSTSMAGDKFLQYWRRYLPKFALEAVVRLQGRALWSPREGALTGLYLGVATEELRERDIRGAYFHPQAVEFDHPHAGDGELQENVWNLCEQLVKDFI